MKLKTSPAPHLRSTDTTKKIMIDVLIALIPAVIVSTYIFGIKALFIMIFSMITAELVELFIMKVLRKKKDFIPDYSASVTGLLLGMNLSLAVEWWQILIGVIVAIAIAKHAFGGLGQNIFNPALVGRVFMVISFPTAMTTWNMPVTSKYINDAVSMATPLAMLKEQNFTNVFANYSYSDMFFGNIPGSIGEVSAFALIVGFIYLVLRKRIKIGVPISYIGTVLIFSSIFYLIDPTKYGTPLLHILTGGLILGALFMATDMVTSPMTLKGQMIFGVGLGVITMVIRYFGAYPEGVSFSILIMNALVPLIDIFAKPLIYGHTRKGDKK